MNDHGFDLPWRIHWRIESMSARSTNLEAIRECNPLVLIIESREVEPLMSIGLPWPQTQVTGIVHNWRSLAKTARDIPVSRWEIPVKDVNDARQAVETLVERLPPERTSLRWYPLKGELAMLEDVLHVAKETGWGLTLPNRPAMVIESLGSEAFPDANELDPELLEVITGTMKKTGHERIRIHDFIISQALGIEGPEPQGCEAGGAIAYVEDDGTVYPCSTLKVPLGNLRKESFIQIWSGPERLRIREEVARMPDVCGRCEKLVVCRGGCRGAVYHLDGGYDLPDPLCHEYFDVDVD